MTLHRKISQLARIISIALFVVAFTVPINLGSLQSAYYVAALNNGLAKTPPMGWNSWNIFNGNIDETKIKQIADAMVSSGMRDAGYVYLNLDDNWMANPARDATGNLRCDPTRFPSGMKALGDYIHSKGLKFGIYGCRGTMTCMGVPQSGSYGNEQRDANTFASWGVDYLKYDNCNAVGNMQTDYQGMQGALANCGRSIVFSICAWQYQSWMPATGNLWRVSPDITDKWDNGTNYFKGIINAIDANAGYANSASPGAWNDPDMLEIGNGGCTTEEYRSQMSMWSIMAAPLIAGNDIRTMSQTTKDILLNSEIIAVDQDQAGIQGTRVSAGNGLEVWCKPLGLANGTTKAVALLNRNGTAANITVNFAGIGLSGTVTVRDLWAKADRGSFSGSYTMSVPSHGTGILMLTGEPTPVGSYVKFSNAATGLYIDGMGSTANGSNACQWGNSNSTNQQWTITNLGSYVTIQNRATGLYLDGMGRTSNGSVCGQWGYSGSTNQQWIQETTGSYVRFKNSATGLYLDGMGSTGNGSNLCQWGNSGSANQQWQIQ
jgi:alpha-galactosidase